MKDNCTASAVAFCLFYNLVFSKKKKEEEE